MTKLIMTKGLIGCGKTTWSREYQKAHPNTVRVNKDDLRAMLHNSVHSRGREKFILETRDFIVRTSLIDGRDVIVDDTNLNPIHETNLQQLALNCMAKFETQDFTGVPLEVCIKQDRGRENPVGEKAIRAMYNQYLKPKIEPVKDVSGIPRAIICDLDGTLCLFGDKNPYDRDFENDEINPAVRYILDGNDAYNKIVFVSGRSDKFRDVTEKWLTAHGLGWPLFMRKEGDVRKDVEVKREIYENEIKGKYNVLFVLDDRPQVCRLWYSLGLPLLKFGDPDADF